MRKATRRILDRICATQLLANAGKVFEEGSGRIIVVPAWADALKYSASPEWESVQLRKQNELSQAIRQRAPDESEKWSMLVDEFKAILNPLIEEQRKIAVADGRPWVPHIAYALLSGCMETEFAEFIEPDFGTEILNWYLRGRFPCGWGRCLPGGRIKLTEVAATNVEFTPENVLVWPVLEHLSGDLAKLKLPGKLLVC